MTRYTYIGKQRFPIEEKEAPAPVEQPKRRRRSAKTEEPTLEVEATDEVDGSDCRLGHWHIRCADGR